MTKEKEKVLEEVVPSDSTILQNINTMEEYEILLDSGAIPSSLNTPQKLMAVISLGRELGLPPLTSVNNIHVIKGRTVISAAILGAMLKQRNIEYVWTKDFVSEENPNGDEPKIVTEIEFEFISRVTNKPKTTRFEVSWAQMDRAGYTTKDNWQKYPKEMLRARCMAYAVRALFPEVLLGVYTDMEIADALDVSHEVVVTDEGDTVIVNND